jgi:hypothetical protein
MMRYLLNQRYSFVVIQHARVTLSRGRRKTIDRTFFFLPLCPF